MKSIILCRRGCCPVLSDNEDGTWKINDDFGGEVILTKEQLEFLQACILNEKEIFVP